METRLTSVLPAVDSRASANRQSDFLPSMLSSFGGSAALVLSDIEFPQTADDFVLI